MIIAIQIMAIAYFIAAIKMKFWRTSLNTFVVFGAIFLVTVLSHFESLAPHWIEVHLSVVAFTMTFMMGRVVYQRCIDTLKKNKEDFCKGCERWKN
jgi:hypothetical protein